MIAGPTGLTAYLAATGFERQLANELDHVVERYGRLFLCEGPQSKAYWSQNVWLNPFILKVKSISDTAACLRSVQRYWYPYSFHLHRRTELIQQKLPQVLRKPTGFPSPLPRAPLGSWTLIDKNTVLAAPACTSPFPHGEPWFHEDREGPPSRAYLKLWEALTLLQRAPGTGDRCLELGASPGGWTWVLKNLGTRVTAIDRAPLRSDLMADPLVSFRKGNAFAATPDQEESYDWIFSDVICYPEKLYDFASLWLESGKCSNFVCTLKFQGTSHYGIIKRFADLPNSRILHLFHNRHELTWMSYDDNKSGAHSFPCLNTF